jgi:phosphatidylglycerol:prolipoprotein diacylglycerol transferase
MLQVVWRIPLDSLTPTVMVVGGVIFLALVGVLLGLNWRWREEEAPGSTGGFGRYAMPYFLGYLAFYAVCCFAVNRNLPTWEQQFPDGIPIYGFGLMLFFAFILCTWLAGKRGEREGIKKETIQDLAIWIFVGGLLGARTTFLMQETPRPTMNDFFLSIKDLFTQGHIPKLFRIWDGGIILYGSILGGIAGYALAWLLIYRKQNLSTRRLLDVIAPCIALGLCLGRIGCFLNGCCFGQVACPDCAVYPVSFPMSAPPRELLVRQGVQTVAGFTLVARQPPGVKGAQVALVDPDSPAWEAGLRPGSVIVKVKNIPLMIDDKIVKDHDVLSNADLGNLLSLADWPRGQSLLTLEYLPQPGETPREMAIKPRTLGLYPTQLYEVVSMALLFLVLLAYEPFRRNPGQVAAVLMVGYGIHRYLDELLRGDPRPEGFEKYGSFVVCAAGVALWLWLWRKEADPPATPLTEHAEVKTSTAQAAPAGAR